MQFDMLNSLKDNTWEKLWSHTCGLASGMSRVHLSGAFCLCGWILTTHVQRPFMRPLCFSLLYSPLCHEIVDELAQCYYPMSSFSLLGTLYLGLANLQNLAAGFGHLPCMGHMRGAHRFWWGDSRARDHLEDTAIGWRIILKWRFKKWDG